MTRWFRVAYAAVAFALVAGLVVQVFLIGLFVFNPRDGGALLGHQTLGWTLHVVPVLVLVLAYLGRGGRQHWLPALALAIVVFIVPILALLRESSVVFAALHPVAAMLSFALAVAVARNSWRLARGSAADPAPSVPVATPGA